MINYDKSLIFKLRLLLAYRDILRTKVPPITKRYIQRFRTSQQEAAKRLKGKEKIDVAFFLTIPGMWKSDYLFRAMQANPKYHPYIVIYPYSQYKGFSRKHIQDTIEQTRKFISEKGYEYVIPYDKKRGKWHDIKKTLNPDIVFFSSPYKDHLPKYFIYHFADTLTCYLSYGFQIFSYYYQLGYNLLFHNLVGCYFLETPIHKDIAIANSRIHGANGIVTGYPATEVFLDKTYTPHDTWKPQAKPMKRVIWAPHQSIEESGTLSLSTFLIYHDTMLKLADKYADSIQFAFKPHQLLKFKLQMVWGVEKTEEYYRKWDERPNTQLEESSYVDLFLTSDAMIHDSASFTTEYIFTQKPVMFLVRNDKVREKLSPFGEKMFDAHYHAHCAEDIDKFLSDTILNGNDPKSAERNDVFEKYLQPIDGMMPSERIIYELEKIINSSDK